MTRQQGIILAILIGLILLICGLLLTGPKDVEATVLPKVDVCHYDGQSGNYQTLNIAVPAAIAHLQQHEPDYPGECDEEEVTPTPTPEVTPTPTEEPCIEDEGQVFLMVSEDDELCEEPEVTPTPEPEPQPEVIVTSSGPVGRGDCPDSNPEKPAANVHVYRDGDTATVKWVPDNASAVHLYWFENQAPDNKHALASLPNDGEEVINGLGTLDWTFGVQQVNGCSGGLTVWVVDGAQPRLFRASYVN